MSKQCTVTHHNREVIEDKLLTALEDGHTVAALLQEADLDLLIHALDDMAEKQTYSAELTKKARDFAADMRQLRKAAFGT